MEDPKPEKTNGKRLKTNELNDSMDNEDEDLSEPTFSIHAKSSGTGAKSSGTGAKSSGTGAKSSENGAKSSGTGAKSSKNGAKSS